MNKFLNTKTRILSILLIVLVLSFGVFYQHASASLGDWFNNLIDRFFGSTNEAILPEEYFNDNLPGFAICQELRRITEDMYDQHPTLEPPYEVLEYTVTDSSHTSGGTSGGSTATTATSSQGSIFQKWFLDSCIMDGYLTEVAHIDLTHRFEVKESIFAKQLIDKLVVETGIDRTEAEEAINKEGINLGMLFEEAFMEVTRADGLVGRNEDTDGVDDAERLAEASLKDFFLAIKDSNEQFMTDLLQAISEKETLNLEYLKSYELAKIEKAREDVNKLTYEVYRELIEEPLVYDKDLSGTIIRKAGLKVIEDAPGDTCPFGVFIKNDTGTKECVVVKKEGRVIQNLDDFIYEEPIQKARDFLMCYFAPWRHFPIGEDYWFAATQGEMDDNAKTKYGTLRDGTDPVGVLTAGPVCGEGPTETARQTCRTEPFSYRISATVTIDTTRCPPTTDDDINDLKTSNLRQIMECRICTREKLDGDATNSTTPNCNYEYICEKARELAGKRPDMFNDGLVPDTDFEEYVKKLCPSDQLKERIKEDMLLDMARKYKFLYNAPPEHWYYGLIGDIIPDLQRCALIQANLGHDIDGIGLKTLANPLRDSMSRAYQLYQRKIWATELPISVAYRPDPTDKDYALQGISLTSSDKFGLQSYAEGIISEIVDEYQALRSSEYLVGEGLRNEKHLIGFADDDGKYFFIDTENIISPALFLKEKVAAATQAQFDLAQLAWKQNPESGGADWVCPHPFVPVSDPPVLAKNDFDAPPGPYDSLENICKDTNKGLEHGWYLIETTDPGTPADEKKYECRWPQFNDITCSVFGYITTQAIKNTSDLPDELPAPWEDLNEYMQISDEYEDWFEGDITIGTETYTGEELGVRKAPPSFDLAGYADDFATEYPDLTADDAYPNIYGAAYGKDSGKPMPAPSDKYYTNKWYKGVTQLYSKPMSEILRTWFVVEP